MRILVFGEITSSTKSGTVLPSTQILYGDRHFQTWWRLKKNQILPCERRLRDGSYLSTVHASQRERRQAAGGVPVRVVEYHLEGVEGAEPLYRLATSVLDPERAPARELAALYHERWEIETAFDELKTHLRGSRIVLRSKKPDLVRQEFYGLLLAHFAVRKLMHEAALQADLDPDRLSFLHAVRVVRRKLPIFAATPPLGTSRASLRPPWRKSSRTGEVQPGAQEPACGEAQDELLSAQARSATLALHP